MPMGTDQAESHTARKFRRISVCLAPVDVQVMLFSISCISILSSVVAMSVTSKRRPPRPFSPRPSPPLHLRTAATKQLPVWVSKKTVKTHSSRIERRAARGGGAEQRRASSRGWLRVTEREKQIGPWGAEKHRLAPPRTPISNFGSRSEPPGRQPPAAASTCP